MLYISWYFSQVPDFLNAKIDGVPVKEVIKDNKWLEEEFTHMVQTVSLKVLKLVFVFVA